jgi:hypothetical protein
MEAIGEIVCCVWKKSVAILVVHLYNDFQKSGYLSFRHIEILAVKERLADWLLEPYTIP